MNKLSKEQLVFLSKAKKAKEVVNKYNKNYGKDN